MSLMLPGLGQAYADHIGRAVIWLLGIVAMNWQLRDAVQGPRTAALVLALNVAAAIDAAIVTPRTAPPRSR